MVVFPVPNRLNKWLMLGRHGFLSNLESASKGIGRGLEKTHFGSMVVFPVPSWITKGQYSEGRVALKTGIGS